MPRSTLVIKSNPITDDYFVSNTELGCGMSGKVQPSLQNWNYIDECFRIGAGMHKQEEWSKVRAQNAAGQQEGPLRNRGALEGERLQAHRQHHRRLRDHEGTIDEL